MPWKHASSAPHSSGGPHHADHPTNKGLTSNQNSLLDRLLGILHQPNGHPRSIQIDYVLPWEHQVASEYLSTGEAESNYSSAVGLRCRYLRIKSDFLKVKVDAFSGFSVGCCINEEKVICYQIELNWCFDSMWVLTALTECSKPFQLQIFLIETFNCDGWMLQSSSGRFSYIQEVICRVQIGNR